MSHATPHGPTPRSHKHTHRTTAAQEAADALYQAFQGKPFNSLEPWLRCRLAFLQGLSFAPTASAAAVASGDGGGNGNGSGNGTEPGEPQKVLEQQHAALVMDIEMGPSSSSSSSASSSSSKPELPQCVVCLESLGGLQQPPSPRKCAGGKPPPQKGGGKGKGKAASAAASASASAAASAAAAASAVAAQQVLVTACNHAFHMDCLRRLAGPLCPVCRCVHARVDGWMDGSVGGLALAAVGFEVLICCVGLRLTLSHLDFGCNHQVQPRHGRLQLLRLRRGTSILPIILIHTHTHTHRRHGPIVSLTPNQPQNTHTPTHINTQCGRTTDLWVCLVCGFIGCGRYHAQHSRRHYLETLHAYAIEVQTQQVRC